MARVAFDRMDAIFQDIEGFHLDFGASSPPHGTAERDAFDAYGEEAAAAEAVHNAVTAGGQNRGTNTHPEPDAFFTQGLRADKTVQLPSLYVGARLWDGGEY